MKRQRSRLATAGVLLPLGFVLAFALPATAAIEALTQDISGSGCTSTTPVSNAAGDAAAWQSDCNPTGANADGSLEIFRATVGSPPTQLTTGSNCSSARPSSSADGLRIAFESNCDLTGGNPDGNLEIFLWKNGNLAQLTASLGCDNLAPSLNGPGTFMAFESTCNLSGTSNDGRGSEIFRVSASGTLKQLTVDAVGDCDSTSASIDDSGTLVAFDSDCDLVGQNEDFAIEIFTVTAAGVVKQRTTVPDDSCSNVRPSMDGSGSLIAFLSDCDLIGNNGDRSDEIFTTDVAGSVKQVTNAGPGTACASGEPRMATSGDAVVYSSYCNANNSNPDGSIEVFQVGVGAAVGESLAVTQGAGCSSIGGSLSASGTRVMLDSDCNLASNNSDLSVEIFRAGACVCGGPVSRKAPPKASDALRTLRAAVGSDACAKCECDTNNDNQISAGDALRVLKKAVGQDGVSLVCPAL